MLKRGIFLVSIIFVILLQLNLVLSLDTTYVTYTYTSVSDNIKATVYKIDNSFISNYDSLSTNKITISYAGIDPKRDYDDWFWSLTF